MKISMASSFKHDICTFCFIEIWNKKMVGITSSCHQLQTWPLPWPSHGEPTLGAGANVPLRNHHPHPSLPQRFSQLFRACIWISTWPCRPCSASFPASGSSWWEVLHVIKGVEVLKKSVSASVSAVIQLTGYGVAKFSCQLVLSR